MQTPLHLIDVERPPFTRAARKRSAQVVQKRARQEEGKTAHPSQPPVMTLEEVIEYIAATTDDQWQTDVVRSQDGSKNCFFGHLFNMNEDEGIANQIWEWFESTWATTYTIYPINDGTNPNYPQETPKARILAYLKNLQNGTEETTMDMMEANYIMSSSVSKA